MNSLLPTAIAFVSLLGSAFALTDDDLAPAALAGKMLTFTIESGTAPLAASGSWTGKFETSPANGFTIRNVSGATANASAPGPTSVTSVAMPTPSTRSSPANRRPPSLSGFPKAARASMWTSMAPA